MPSNAYVACRICATSILLSGEQHVSVVRCPTCDEFTPVGSAPPGKKFVRCPCNCLLMVSEGAKHADCPRSQCQRVVELGEDALAYVEQGASPDVLELPAASRPTRVCAYCSII